MSIAIPGTTAAEAKLWLADLVDDHQVHIKIESITLDHDDPRDMSDRLLDGQVTVSAVAEVSTRELTVSLLDPDATLGFDSGDPADGVMFADRMLRVLYGTRGQRLKRWVYVPIFTGPVTALDRDGYVVALRASSKEILGGEVWAGFTVKKGTNKVDAIKQIMAKSGESRWRTSATTSKLGAQLSVANPQTFWLAAKKVAQSIDRQIFYDGDGKLVVRPAPTAVSYTFSEGEGGSVLTEPQVSYDPASLKNVVQVKGRKPKKGKTPVYNAYAPSDHPLSPRRLGRNGQPRYIAEKFQSDSYRSLAECKKRAITLLESKLTETINVKFDALVIPHLEPNDKCKVAVGRMDLDFWLREYTIPLTPGGVMTVGYVRRQKLSAAMVKALRQRRIVKK